MPSMLRPPAAEIEELVAFLGTTEVRPGARILDAPCGIGRRAYALAERGVHVTAVDANKVAIDGLRQRAPEELEGRLTCRTTSKETMPGLPVSESFQVILCLDHALGRNSTGEDVAFLGRLLAHLAPEGLLLVDFLHRDFFAARPRPFAYHVLGDLEQHEFRSFDPVSGVLDLTWKFYQRDGKNLRFRGNSSTRLKLLAPHEARHLLEAAGWKVEALYGGWNKEAVSPDHRKILLVTRPAARG